MNNRKIELCIRENAWHYVLESGLPEDGTWCFVISSVNRDIDLFVGGYNKNNHTFYANYGDGGQILNDDSVIAWTEFNNSFLREN